MNTYLWVLAISLTTLWSSVVSAQKLAFDQSSSKLQFKIKNTGLWVDGYFEEYIAEAVFDPSNLGKSYFSATIMTRSIKTGIGARDTHLRKDEYFGVEAHPKLTFKSTHIAKTATGYEATGDLHIKSTTRQVKIPFTSSSKDGKMTFKGELRIDRLDYGVGEKSWIMGNDVIITIEAVFEK